jgi:hypothetical protein
VNIKKALLTLMALTFVMILSTSVSRAQYDLDSSVQPPVTAPPKTVSPDEVLQMISFEFPPSHFDPTLLH